MIKQVTLMNGKTYRLFTSNMRIEVLTSRVHHEVSVPMYMKVTGARITAKVMAAIIEQDHAEALEMDAELSASPTSDRAFNAYWFKCECMDLLTASRIWCQMRQEALAMDAEMIEATAAMNAEPNRYMTPSQCLRTFLAAWLAWAELDAPKHAVFDPMVGLCSNLECWVNEHCQRMGNDVDDYTAALMHELLGYEDYPFGCDSYAHDMNNRTHHRHAPRLEWVRAQLADLA